MKKTLAQKLHERHVHKPNFILYNLLANVWKLTVARKYHFTYELIDDPKKEKGPYILISNHASRADYIFTALPLLPHRLNYIMGYNEFFRSHLKGIVTLLQEIPKRNFYPDMYTVMEAKRLVKQGGRLCLFPEGMNSIGGGSQPVALGSAKFLKFLDIPVYVCHIDGGYLTGPKYNLTDRIGRVHSTIKRLFTVEELRTHSIDEITDILNKEIWTDDYAYNKKEKILYKTDSVALHAEQLLYKCPKCGAEHIMTSTNNSIVCPKCGYEVLMDNYYNIKSKDGSFCFDTPKDWFEYEREEVKKEIQDPNFYFEEEVDVGFLPEFKPLKDQKTSEIRGSGILRIDHNGIHFKGTKDGAEYNMELTLQETPTYGMCTDASRFYTFNKGEFVEFYPRRNSTIKWLFVTEELHRLHGGKWQNYKK